MNDELVYRALVETARWRALTPAEEARLQAYLAQHPEVQPDWEEEARLTQVLRQLPDAPVSSNFTALVVQRARRHHVRRRRSHRFGPLRWLRSLRWLWQVAVAGLAVGLALMAYEQYRGRTRAELVRSVVTFSDVAALPGPEVLRDFDAIKKLPQTAPADDDELLAALK